jgi:hypothetical protein
VKASWIDAEVVFDRPLATRADLDVLQEVLLTAAPKWTSKLRLRRSRHDERSIDVTQSGTLNRAILSAVAERGSTFEELVKRYGRPEFDRSTGSAELRGTGPELVVIVSIDEWPVCPLGTKTHLGNSISLQVRRRTVEGRNGDAWVYEIFEALCTRLSPAWGAACHPDEYWSKVMTASPRVEALGRDFGRFLPGLFWLNFFGSPYRKLIGDERLRSARAERILTVDGGFIISLARRPESWTSPEYSELENRVRHHLGPEFFFSRSGSSTGHVAPSWVVARR